LCPKFNFFEKHFFETNFQALLRLGASSLDQIACCMYHQIVLKKCIAAAAGILPANTITAIIAGTTHILQIFRGRNSAGYSFPITCAFLLTIFGSFPPAVYGLEATLIPFLFLLIVNKSTNGTAFVLFPVPLIFVVLGCRDEKKFNKKGWVNGSAL
jgi:hypothetical protein